MATMLADVPGALASLAIQWWKHSTTKTWLTLLFRILFSGFLAFLLIGGSSILTLLLKSSPSVAFVGGIANGMIWAAGTMIYVFKTDKSGITKGMTIMLPMEAMKDNPTTTFNEIPSGKDTKK
jgi:hypothetical protein